MSVTVKREPWPDCPNCKRNYEGIRVNFKGEAHCMTCGTDLTSTHIEPPEIAKHRPN